MKRREVFVGGPYFDELGPGTVVDSAPAVTSTSRLHVESAEPCAGGTTSRLRSIVHAHPRPGDGTDTARPVSDRRFTGLPA